MLVSAQASAQVRRLAGRVAWAAVDLLFPPRCVACGMEGAFLCSACQEKLPALEPPFCTRCAAPLTKPREQGLRCGRCREGPLALDGILAPYRMEGVAQEAVHALKYRNLRAVAPTMGGLLAQYARAEKVPGEVIVPVPLYRARLRQRGYNQAELLARALGHEVGLPVEHRGLQRVRATRPQVGATEEERRQNVQGAFRATASFSGRSVLLVDDVCTTGATLDACAVAVREAGASGVWGLVFAREA